MPGSRETCASGKVAEHGLAEARQSGALEAIVCDATAAEAAACGAPEHAKQRLPYPLNSTSTVVRGSRSHQTRVYPPNPLPTTENLNPPVLELTSLVLHGLKASHRALIVNLGSLFLMV
jgi:hypothetical protein